jgi:hypothetical protein
VREAESIFGQIVLDNAEAAVTSGATLIDMTAVRLGVIGLILSRRVRPLAIAPMAFNLLRAAGALVGRDYARARAAPSAATWSPSLGSSVSYLASHSGKRSLRG